VILCNPPLRRAIALSLPLVASCVKQKPVSFADALHGSPRLFVA